MEYIITVDEQDRETGYIEKLEAHKQGVLHRAFSILVLNKQGEILLQKRNKDKYHSPGLWTNTCCSHQRVGEELTEAVTRRLMEEMGFVCELKELFHFIYKTRFDDGLTEHELDHVFIGEYDGEIAINEEEVEEYKWVPYSWLEEDMKEHPEHYTYWFKILMDHSEMRKFLQLKS